MPTVKSYILLADHLQFEFYFSKAELHLKEIEAFPYPKSEVHYFRYLAVCNPLDYVIN